MRFGQLIEYNIELIEYNMRNSFLKKPYAKYGGQTSLRFFPGKLKLSISLD